MKFNVLPPIVSSFLFCRLVSVTAFAQERAAVEAPAETLKLAVFADFSECGHSFRDACALQIRHDPNIEISLAKSPNAPGTWKGSAVRNDSFLGLDAYVDIEVQKVIDRRISEVPHYEISARVRKADGAIMIPWVGVSFFGEPKNINRVFVSGPEFDNVDAGLFKAKMFLYVNAPFESIPALHREGSNALSDREDSVSDAR